MTSRDDEFFKQIVACVWSKEHNILVQRRGMAKYIGPERTNITTARLDLSIEILIIKPKWASLFTGAGREIAKSRLEKHTL